jgi:hypothetical protein
VVERVGSSLPPAELARQDSAISGVVTVQKYASNVENFCTGR